MNYCVTAMEMEWILHPADAPPQEIVCLARQFAMSRCGFRNDMCSNPVLAVCIA